MQHNATLNARLKRIIFYDPATNQWTNACPMNIARSVAGVASPGGSIYVAGGYNGKDYLDTVKSFDIELNKWLPCPSMNVRRSALGRVAYYGGSLYACGGLSGSFQSSVEKLVPGMELWENCVPMTLGKVHFAILYHVHSFLLFLYSFLCLNNNKWLELLHPVALSTWPGATMEKIILIQSRALILS